MTHKERKEKSKHIWQKGKDETYMWYVHKENKEEREENTFQHTIPIDAYLYKKIWP